MPRRILLALLAAAMPSLAAAQMARGVAEAIVTDEVLAFRERIRTAAGKKDRQALAAAYADNFRHFRDSGRVDLKNERIALLVSGESTIETAPEENMVVQVFTPALAVVSGVSPIKDRQTGRSPAFRWLTVYMKQGDAWQVAISQASRVRRAER